MRRNAKLNRFVLNPRVETKGCYKSDAVVLNSMGLFYCHLVLVENSNDNSHASNKGYSLVRALYNLSKESGDVHDFLQITEKKKLKYPTHPLNSN